jgi:hypothetical protein
MLMRNASPDADAVISPLRLLRLLREPRPVIQ